VSEIQYARQGDDHIAYQVHGEPGRVDVVLLSAALFPFELLAEDRVSSRFTAGLAALGRLVVFDKRGVGLSDPITDWTRSPQEQWADDLLSVVDAAGLHDPVLVSWDPWGAARVAAARQPERFSALVLLNPSNDASEFRRILLDPDQPLPTRPVEERAFPSRIRDADFTAWLERSGRTGASPAVAARIWNHLLSRVGPLTPPVITTRTLVLHRRDSLQSESGCRAVADAIPDASFVQLAGADHFPISGPVDDYIAEITEFVTGAPTALTPLRQVAAVLFTDLVGSTQRAVVEGDDQWRRLLDIHDRAVEIDVRHFGGRVVKYTGDGVLALMTSATAALDAVQAVRSRLADQGLRIRAGIHVGDVDRRGDDVSGIAVNIAARIMSHADADETLVSEAARQSILGSHHTFEVQCTTSLKGVPDEWTLHRFVP
jgi:class 3 adenylate cyclase/pimeloyl-ACP methyl ester carboxylesterase